MFADPSGAAFASAQVPVRTLNARVLDAAFTKTVYEGAYPGGPDALRRDHRFVDEAAPLGEHWAHKYLLDLDGMGYSAKFFALMESESAVVKATVFDEFWSDWAQPWSVPPFFAFVRRCATLLAHAKGALGKVALYPAVGGVPRDIQHSRVLLGPGASGVGRSERRDP